MVAYEVGYTEEGTDFAMLHRAVDLAARHHLTMNFFYHPVYIARVEACRRAIDEMLRYLEERGLRPAFMGPDEVWRWWSARSEARIEEVVASAGEVSFAAECGYPSGFVVKVPLGFGRVEECRRNGRKVEWREAWEFGQRWAFVVLPRGRSRLRLRIGRNR